MRSMVVGASAIADILQGCQTIMDHRISMALLLPKRSKLPSDVWEARKDRF